MSSFLRKAIDLLWMKGPIHEPVEDGDYSNLRDGIANNIDDIRTDVKNVAYIRDPGKTPILSDLEREYGVTVNTVLTEAQRRTLLDIERYKKKTTAQDDQLQDRLDRAGFDLTVYNNSPDGPAIDPAIILDQNFQMQAQTGTNYFAGNTDAYAGRLGGYLLVNGAIFSQIPAYYGAGDLYAGNDNAVAGYFDYLKQIPVEYPIPTDSGDFPLVFFVGGDATFNPDGSIADISVGFVPNEQRKKLEDIILQFKPMFTWCGLVISYI